MALVTQSGCVEEKKRDIGASQDMTGLSGAGTEIHLFVTFSPT